MKPIYLTTVLVLTLFSSTLPADKPHQPGISKTKPAEGRSVKIDGGYMVPYSLTIPGTEIAIDMVPIPAGTVIVGSPDNEAGREAVEGPQFEVTVEPFWMAKTETTWEQYTVFMDLYEPLKTIESQGNRPVTDDNRIDAITVPTPLYEPSFTYEYGQDPQQPAVTMTQYAARQYTKWLSIVVGDQYRLPTEAQWEHACRAGTTTAYHFGDDEGELGKYAWYYDNTNDEGTQFVGKKKPNQFGLYDMHGNVAEWVIDQLYEDGYKRFAGKKLTDAEATAWPTEDFPRVVKGGSWEFEAKQCRSASRLGSQYIWKEYDPNLPKSPWWFTSDPARGVGFRLIRPLKSVSRKEIEKYWRIDSEGIKDAVENRLGEGRGIIGLVDPNLPEAIKAVE